MHKLCHDTFIYPSTWTQRLLWGFLFFKTFIVSCFHESICVNIIFLCKKIWCIFVIFLVWLFRNICISRLLNRSKRSSWSNHKTHIHSGIRMRADWIWTLLSIQVSIRGYLWYLDTLKRNKLPPLHFNLAVLLITWSYSEEYFKSHENHESH